MFSNNFFSEGQMQGYKSTIEDLISKKEYGKALNFCDHIVYSSTGLTATFHNYLTNQKEFLETKQLEALNSDLLRI